MIAQTLLSICIGIGLSAACGFRVFVPMLLLSVGAKLGYVPLAENFQWLSSTPAIICLSVATLCEVLAYFIPMVDHFLDVISSPLAVVAGTFAMAAVITHVDPWLQWSLALIAGGGLAAATQSSTVALRLGSTATTGGFGNPFFALLELGASMILTLLSIVLPVIAAVVGILIVLLIAKWIGRFRRAARS